MADEFLTVASLPPEPSPADLHAFFGIPPHPESDLDDLIARKRRHWHGLAASSPAGRDKAKRVKKLIQDAADAIKRGTAMPAGHDGDPEPAAVPKPVRTLTDVWGELEELLFGQRVQAALDLASQALGHWRNDPAAHAMYAWTVAGIAQSHQLGDQTVRSGIDAAEFAVADRPNDPARWDTLVRLLLAVGDNQGALGALGRAEQVLPVLDGRLLTAKAVGVLRTGKPVDGLAVAVAAIETDPSDMAVRSLLVEALIREALEPALPITSSKEMAAFERAVAVTAWCAHGAPEAEDRVRPFRLWATRAAQRVFTGRWSTRSAVAVLSGFVALPFYNRWRSSPCWEVFLAGPSHQLWSFVSSADFVEVVHRNAQARVPWQGGVRAYVS